MLQSKRLLHISWRAPLNCQQRDYWAVAHVVFALTCLLNAAAPAFAQGSAAPSTEKWRPIDGIYASPGMDFDSQCGEFGDVIIDIPAKSISGHEWSCKITKLVDTAPAAIRLDMTCNDYNLALNINARDPNAYDRKFKEIMLLRRTNGNAMSVRKTLNGKFEGPAWRADYCSEEKQRMYAEAVAINQAKTEYRIPEQLSNPEQWRPRDGVYASPGADFNDRCTKSGDVIIGLTDGSVSTGQTECKAVGMTITGTASFSMGMACSQASGKQTITPKKKNSETTSPETRDTETIRLKKIDDNTFFLQKTQNREFKDAGGPVSYCPEEVQRIHAARQAKK